MSYPYQLPEEEWKKKLTATRDQYEVLRMESTEAPFKGIAFN